MLSFIFIYLDKIKVKVVDNEKVYNNLRDILNRRFHEEKFQGVKNILKKVSSSLIDNVPYEKMISRNRLLPKYNKEMLKRFADYLTLNNTIIYFSHHNSTSIDKYANYKNFLENFDENNLFQDLEPYLNTKFGIYKISNIKFTNHNITYNATITNYKKKTNYTNICKTKECIIEYKKDSFDMVPETYKLGNIATLWFKRDRSFINKKIKLIVEINLSFDFSNIRYISLMKMFIFYLNHWIISKDRDIIVRDSIK